MLDYCTVDNVKAVLQIKKDKWSSKLPEINSRSALADNFFYYEDLESPPKSQIPARKPVEAVLH